MFNAGYAGLAASMEEIMDKQQALVLYETMYRIRAFEEEVEKLFAAGELPGFFHLYIGEEAVATGVCAHLTAQDYITSTHRGHGHCIAKGGDLSRMMAELYGKKDGYNKGKGSSLHLAAPELGILGANGILAAGLPIACGAALSSVMQNRERVAVAFFGDAASNQGAFHESLNFASTLKLPVVFVCENNMYGVGTRFIDASASPDVSRRADGYLMPGVIVDGQDVQAVYDAAGELIAEARAGKGPALLECKTWRYRGHFQGEPAQYRSKEEESHWLERDPLTIAAENFTKENFLTSDDLVTIEKRVQNSIKEAVAFARNSPHPQPEEALTDVYA